MNKNSSLPNCFGQLYLRTAGWSRKPSEPYRRGCKLSGVFIFPAKPFYVGGIGDWGYTGRATLYGATMPPRNLISPADLLKPYG
jgi:hypothetical protein